MKNLYLIGGGGHCHSCIDVIEAEGKFIIRGIIDQKENLDKKVLGYDIVGTDDDLEKFISSDNYFIITVGQIKTAQIRMKIYNILKSMNANIATIVSPRAYVSAHAKIGEGSIVMHNALINANARVGVNTILNSKCLVEHDVVIEDHCHISTAAILNGNCHIERESFIGSNSVLKEGIMVKANSIIPAGSFFRG